MISDFPKLREAPTTTEVWQKGNIMKVISVWQPFASLLIHGFKRIETRGLPAPKALIGERIGIASTKLIRPDQRAAAENPLTAAYYTTTGLGPWEELPHGYLLGTTLLHSCDPITEEDLEDVTEEEQAFGWWAPGRYAWRTRDPHVYDEPIRVRGAQGIWNFEFNDKAVIPFRAAV